MFTSFVMSLAAMFSGSAVSFGGRLMLLGRGRVCFNYVVVFVHLNTPCLDARPSGVITEQRCTHMAFQ